MKLVINPALVRTSPSSDILNPSTGASFEANEDTLALLELFSSPTTIQEALGKIDTSESGTAETIEAFIQTLIDQDILTQEVLDSETVSIDDFICQKPVFSLEIAKQTFLSCPNGEYDTITEGSVVFLGAPFDLATSGYPGARLSPNAIRKISAENTEYHCDVFSGETKGWFSSYHNSDVLVGYKFIDLGNVPYFIGESLEDYYVRLSEAVFEIVSRGGIPVVIGGDHSISYSVLQGISKVHSKAMSILHFDAHTDFANLYEETPHNHGNVFTRAYRDGLIEDMHQFGIRCGSNKTLPKVCVHPWAGMCDQDIVSFVDSLILPSEAYLSIDIDVLDPVFAPGTGTPSSCGMNPEYMFKLIHLLAKKTKIIGFDLVEVNPMLDVNNVTCGLANDVIFHTLSCML
jgi:agmatinase